MHPFIPEELGDGFDLGSALETGLLPSVWASEDREETLAAYAQLYVKEEVHAEALVRNLPAFSRFLPLSALCHGQVVNVCNLAREAQVARTTVVGYLDVLEETLLCFRLPGYEAGLRVRERKLPKLYWCDPGVVRAMRRAFGPPSPEERGALFEGLVAQTLRAYRDYRRAFQEMSYWSSSGGCEVDFLLTRGSEFVAVEAKSGKVWNAGWCKGLRAITALKGLRRRLVVYPEGPALRTDDGIDVVPYRQFAEWLQADTFWPA
jgi:predicted AAA+ superfamily ATPase